MTSNLFRSLTRVSTAVGAVSAGVLLAGHAAAAAQPEALDMSTFGNIGIANGIQAAVPVQVPVNVCGVSIGLFGKANSKCQGSASVKGGMGDISGDWNTSLNVGIANGIQAGVPVQAPVNVCGVALGLFGEASADCAGSSTINAGAPHMPAKPYYNSPRQQFVPDDRMPAPVRMPAPAAARTGNIRQVAPKAAPELLGGLLGMLPLEGLLGLGGGKDKHGYGQGYGKPHGMCHSSVDMDSSLNAGIANGIQVYAPVQVPVNVSGVAVGLFGDASAVGNGTASASMCG